MKELASVVIFWLFLWAFSGMQVRYSIDGIPHVMEINLDVSLDNPDSPLN